MWRTAVDRVLRPAGLVIAALAAIFVLAPPGLAEETPIRVAVSHHGAAAWEMETIRNHGLDMENGVALEVVSTPYPNTTISALREREVDMIIGNWIWVSRTRAEGERFAFMPFSQEAGTLLKAPDAGIETIDDLRGKRIGVANSPREMSWLMIRGLVLQERGFDLRDEAEIVYGEPDLLEQRYAAGMLDAVVTKWGSAERLEANGMERVLNAQEAARLLGAERRMALLGFVFRDDWAEANREAVLGLLEASRQAKSLLRESDEAWEQLRDFMDVDDEATFEAMKGSYRAAIPSKWGAAERGEARLLFERLAGLGGDEFVGTNSALEPGTFWSPARY